MKNVFVIGIILENIMIYGVLFIGILLLGIFVDVNVVLGKLLLVML